MDMQFYDHGYQGIIQCVKMSAEVLDNARLIYRLFNISVRYRAHDFHLLRHCLQYAPHLIITLHKSKLRILKPLLPRKLLHELTRCTEVVSREARKEVMRHLQVQPAVQKRE